VIHEPITDISFGNVAISNVVHIAIENIDEDSEDKRSHMTSFIKNTQYYLKTVLEMCSNQFVNEKLKTKFWRKKSDIPSYTCQFK